MNNVVTPNGHAAIPSTNGGAPARHTDQLQMDVGTYIGFAHDIAVLELFVERDPSDPYNTARSIEHWGLYAAYTWPSSANQDYAIQFKYAGAQDPSAADFRARMRQITGVTYVQAACQRMTL